MTLTHQIKQMNSDHNDVADQDLANDEKEWLYGKDSDSKKDNPLKLIISFGFIGVLIFKNTLYPSPLIPKETCTTEKNLTYCTTDRGFWGSDTISFKPEQSKGAFEIEVKCMGGKAWQILSKHEEIPQNIANNHAKKWCKEY